MSVEKAAATTIRPIIARLSTNPAGCREGETGYDGKGRTRGWKPNSWSEKKGAREDQGGALIPFANTRNPTTRPAGT